MPWVADAAGLGRLSVLSSLGQPLNAEIELAAVEKDELATLSARLASPDAYKQANLQYGPALIDLRMSIEKRAGGQPYIKATTTRPINEPFIDLMVELSWASGRITREYTALIDPPGYSAAATAAAPAPVTLPETSPVAAPETPVAAAPIERAAVAAPTTMAGKDYGPIKRGETLYKIADSIRPEGVTLEQMLVGLYRSNPDAFVKNMNRMKTGKILRVPEKEELVATMPREAAREVRVQAADWNSYRRKLADTAALAPEEARGAASGKITTRVEDQAAASGAKDVVRLSKGEPPKGAKGAGKPGDRLRTLEEEAIAREKALTEANERIAQLEKNIQDMQHLLAIKSPGLAAAQQKAEAKPAQKPAVTTKPEEPKPASQPAVTAAKPEAAPPPVGAVPAKKEEPKAGAAPAKPAVAAKPKPKVVPPPPAPGLTDMVMDNLPLFGGGAAILLGGLGYWMVRRRRSQAEAEEEPVKKSAPTLGKDTGVVSSMAAAAESAAPAAPAAETAAGAASSDEVDPLAEAEVYIAYGRDAQAEEILKDALARNPNREDVQLKLLEIYALRKDKTAFAGIAGGLNKLTAGRGENWLKAAAMGYVLDPGNPLYAAGKDASGAMQPPPGETAAGGADLDFDLGASSGGGATATDISFEPVVAQEPRTERTMMMEPGKMQAMAGEAEKAGHAAAETLMPDFTLEIPEAGSSAATATDMSFEAHTPADATNSVIDFNIELPDAGTAEANSKAGQGAPAAKGGNAGAGTDFKLDLGDINLNLDDRTMSGAASGVKDAHWDDVQTKFDLAKAYQEMGDKDGAKEILQEVIKEGDAGQQTEARKLLENLG